MTTLADLQKQAAFDPVPLRAQLAATHVPFEAIVPGAAVEQRASNALRNWERVAVVGPSGSGKSSAIEHILATTPELAGIRISVEAQSDEVVTEPAAFAGHVLRELHRLTSRVGRKAGRALDTAAVVGVERNRRLRAGLSLPNWIGSPGLAGELGSVVNASVERPASQLFEAVVDVIATMREVIDRVPVLTIDDSDGWLRTGLDDRSQLVAGFFSRVLHRVVEEWGVALLIAVHDEYLAMDGYPRDEGWLSTEIHLPRISTRDALRQIVDTRITAASGDGDAASDLVTDEAIDEMLRYYIGHDGNLRKAIFLIHTALGAALDDGADQVGRAHVLVAMTRTGS